MTYETLLSAVDGPVATITLNRPGQLNTIVPPMPDEIEAAVNAAVRDGAVKVIVLCNVMAVLRDANEGDEIFEAAEWAVITADAAERAVYWFEKGDFYDMLWWVVNAVNDAEAVKGLSDFQTIENYNTRRAEVMALLKENGYDVTL